MRERITIVLAASLLAMLCLAQAGNDDPITQLELKLKTASGAERIRILNDLAERLTEKSVEKSKQYGSEALNLAEASKERAGIALAHKNLALACRYAGELEEGQEHLQRALPLFRTLGDQKNEAHVLREMGNIAYQRGEFETAQKHYLDAIVIAERIGDIDSVSRCLNNMGVINLELQNFKQALDCYFKALEVYAKRNDRKNMVSTMMNIGLTYQLNKEMTKALEYYRKSEKLCEELNDQFEMTGVYHSLASFYSENKEPEKSLLYLLKEKKITEEIGLQDRLAYIMGNIGAAYIDMKKYDQALPYITDALKRARELKAKVLERDSLKNLAIIYSETNDFRKGIEYYKQYVELYQQTYSDKQSEQVAEMQARYETLKKQKEIEVLKKNNEILDKDRRLKAASRNVLILAFVLVLIVLGFLVKRYFFLFAFWKRQKYVGHYRLGEAIGSGGMGTIYRARDVLDKSRTVAVKVLREELTEDAEYVKRFKQEAQIIDTLEHPNVVRIFERGESSGRLFIAMEYLQGRTLDAAIETESPLAWKTCFHIMAQVTLALDLIHGKRIIHRDLKPSNIMLVEREGDRHFVKLMDFGLAKSTFQTSLTRTGIVVGTVQYMSPEQLSRSEYSTASDVYSLGVTFYEMATARKAFYGETPTDVMRQVLETLPIEPARYRPDIPAPLNALIMRMMAKSPADRPPLSEILEYLKTGQEKPLK